MMRTRVKIWAVMIGIVFACGCGEAGEAEKGSMNLEEGQSLTADSEEDSFVEQEELEAELGDDEKVFFTGFIREKENYGFLLSDYSAPEDVDLNEVFYGGAGVGEGIPEEDVPLYLEKVQQEFLEMDCLKLPKQDIEEFLQRKLGIGLEDMHQPFEWTYLEETDAYYHEAGDTNYTLFSCTGGSRQGNMYTLYFKPEEDWALWTEECETVIIKTEEGYRFLSNRILGK